MLASLCLAFELMLGALPLSGVVLCVAPGSHTALEFSPEDCEPAELLSTPILAPKCTDYSLAQLAAVPAELRQKWDCGAVSVNADVPVPKTAAPRIQLRADCDLVSTPTPELRSLRTIVLLV